jgi:hypothetical protein
MRGLLLCLWDALFLTDCQRWTDLRVSNTSPSNALEMGYWFHRGQEHSKRPLFEGLCVNQGSYTREDVCCASGTLRSLI